MMMPRFTAEASLYKTSGQYRTGQQVINLPTPMIGVIYPAEVIEVHDCAPGSYLVDNGDGTWDCWSNPDPSWGGGGGGTPGDTGQFEGSEGKGKGKGKGKSGGKTRSKRIVRRGSNLGRDCQGKDVGGDPVKAEIECAAKGKGNDLRTLRCFDNPDGTVDRVCCHMAPRGKSMTCISDIEQVS